MGVDFILTKFMYPLDINNRPVFLGELYFDNPRTMEEINYVAGILKEINYNQNSRFPDRENLVPDDCITLMTIYDQFYKNNCKDINVENFNIRYGKIKNIYKKLARMMVVIRSNSIIDKNDTKGKFVIFKNEDDFRLKLVNDPHLSISEYNEKKVNNYFSFISFMLGTGKLSNNLIANDINLKNNKFDDLFINLIVMAYEKRKDNSDFSYPYDIFNKIESKIIDLSNEIGDRYKEQKFLFICKKIHYLFSIYNLNEEMAFMEIMGLLEMFLTHNPDFNRYNVEDSITKQFKGKMLTILYENDKNIDIENTENKLKFAYSIRSSIAHGNFSEIDRYLDKLFILYGMKKGGRGLDYRTNRDALYKLLSDAMSWLKIVIYLYLKDEQKLELIKKI